MRIAHVTDCYLPRLGGIEMHVRDLAERQSRAGHRVVVVTSTRGAGQPSADGEPGVARLAPGGRRPGSISYRRSRRVAATLAAGDFDVVHVHASTFSPLAFAAARYAALHQVPAVVTVHSLWIRAVAVFRAADLATRWSRYPLVWSAVSDAAALRVGKALGGGVPVTILPNGVDRRAWQVTPEPAVPGELRMVFVGRLAARKRPLELAWILEEAHRRLPPGTRLRAEVVGDGPERRPLERYLRLHGMADWVSVRGALPRDEIRAAFARADLFVAPAELESFGIAALEARCAGLPVLARSGTGTEDFVIHGRNGWLVDSDRAMADAIAELATDRCRLEWVAAHNRSVAPAITWPMVLDRCDALYAGAAGQPRTRGGRKAGRPVGAGPLR